MTRTKEWNTQVEAVKDKYRERIEKHMVGIAKALAEAGFDCTEHVDFWDCDEYRWSVYVRRGVRDAEDHSERDVDVTFQIAESAQCDGSEDGINFTIDIVEVSGRIFGGMCPYNYTNKCWVPFDDEDAIEARFGLIEQADPEGVVECMNNHPIEE